jgi:predicted nucleic acid-binding Zn ribbon protein
MTRCMICANLIDEDEKSCERCEMEAVKLSQEDENLSNKEIIDIVKRRFGC